MEEEQELSRFQPLSREEPWSMAKKLEALSQWSSRYADPDRTDGLFHKVISYFYKRLESLLKEQSSAYFNQQDYLLNPFYRVVQFLKSQDVVNRAWFREERYNDAPSFWHFGLEAAYPEGTTDGRRPLNPLGHGFGKDVQTASSKAIGEFLERYFLTLYQKKNLLRSSMRALSQKGAVFLNLELLAGFSDEQKRKKPIFGWDQESIFRWEKVRRISTKKTFYVPAQLVYWNYLADDGEPLLVEFNTNSCGGMFSKEGALLAGLYEAVQRDGFLVYWLNKLAPPKVDPESLPDDMFQDILRESKRYGFEIHCLNTTSDALVPSFVVVVEDKSGIGPKFCLGGGSQSDPAKALRRALEEAWAVYYWMRRNPPYFLPEHYQPFNDDSLGQDERLRLFANPAMAEHYSFFLAGKECQFSDISFSYPRKFSSEREELKFLVKRIEGLGPGYEVYYYLAQHQALSQLGYFTARVIVPQLVPLHLQETMAALGAKRLKEVPLKLGEKPAETFNPLPHPFP